MSKKQLPTGVSWGEATDELKDKVKFVLQNAQNNRYSVSRIYAAYNAVFELQEAPQTCSTCLTSRVDKLRRWWGEQAPKDTESVPTTGEFQGAEKKEATTYEGVIKKYGFSIGDALGETPQGTAGELATLSTIAETGAEAYGMTGNEFDLLTQRYTALRAQADDDAELALLDIVNGKLEALGINADSIAADRLEAFEALAGDTGNPENGQAIYNAQIEILKREIAGTSNEPAAGVIRFDMGEGVLGMDFTPNADDETKGAILNADGSKVKAGTYTAADGTTIAVSVGGKASIKQ